MKGSCPACGANYDVELAVSEADGKRVIEQVAALPANVGPLTLQYLGLFRPPGGGLRWSRMLTLLTELAPMIREQRMERGGRQRSAPHGFWVEAMQHMVSRPATLNLPLKSHGYLLEIVGGMADALSTKLAREAEEKRHADARKGIRPDATETPRSDPTHVSAIIADARSKLR